MLNALTSTQCLKCGAHILYIYYTALCIVLYATYCTALCALCVRHYPVQPSKPILLQYAPECIVYSIVCWTVTTSRAIMNCGRQQIRSKSNTNVKKEKKSQREKVQYIGVTPHQYSV